MDLTPEMSVKQVKLLKKAQELNFQLSDCETRVVICAVKGYTNKQIAAQLGNRPKTIARHIESITRKAFFVYNRQVGFRSFVVPQLCCFYFVFHVEELLEN